MSEDGDLQPDERAYHLGMAVLAEQLESFWKSDVGQYLLRRANLEYNAALAAFVRCDPTNSKEVQLIQGKLAQATNFKKWLEEGIAEGLRSKNVLFGIEDEISQ